MMLHERLERVAILADAMGLPFAAREIREYRWNSLWYPLWYPVSWFQAKVPVNTGVSWKISWGYRGQTTHEIEVGPEF